MKAKIVISDFDGVIGNSIKVAMEITRRIVDLFDKSEKVTSFNDYYRLLGKESQLKNVTEIESNTLRELYRIMHRHSSNEIKPFMEVLHVYSKLFHKPLIVSSSYSDTIKCVLGDFYRNFHQIYGYESGHKKDILLQLRNDNQYIYVTDTYRDVITCKSINMPVIATTWGYDPIENLIAEKPDYIANDYQELINILSELNYL